MNLGNFGCTGVGGFWKVRAAAADATVRFRSAQSGHSRLRTNSQCHGGQPLPTFSFTPKIKRVRPAFELFEYRRLLRTLIKWQRDCPNGTWLHARRLLTDYVLILATSGEFACPLGPIVNLTLRPRNRLFHLVLESHNGRALVPIPKRSASP